MNQSFKKKDNAVWVLLCAGWGQDGHETMPEGNWQPDHGITGTGNRAVHKVY